MQSDESERIYALSYACVRSPARIDDPDFVRQEAIVERFCGRRDWKVIACLRDVEPQVTRR